MSAVFNGTPQELRTLLGQLPAILAGKVADPWGVVQGLQLRLGVRLLSLIQQAFVVKARGGVGDDGVKWVPLKRSTIAQRRLGKGEKKALGIGGKRVRGLLTPSQDKRWRSIFGSRRAMLMVKFGMSHAAASARAAQIAWTILKSEGAQTKLAVLGGRSVETLRDTGELLRSFTPGVEDRPSGADGQIFKVPPGRVIVGTNKKSYHHKGVPGKLPARPFWPEKLPPAWKAALLGTYQRGMVAVMTRILNSGRVP